jgi:hypothetical protein
VAAAAAAPTGAEQSAFSLRWRLQIQPLLLQRAPQQQQLLTHDAGSYPRRICHRKKKKATDLQRRQRNGTDLKKTGRTREQILKKEHNRKK